MALSLLKRRTALALALMATSAFSLGGEAKAQEFPDRPVTLVVPFAAGGSTDVVARIIGQKMSDDLGQQVIVENVAGAGGNLGAGRVARAEPDGYTILMATVATHALNPLMSPRFRCWCSCPTCSLSIRNFRQRMSRSFWRF